MLILALIAVLSAVGLSSVVLFIVSSLNWRTFVPSITFRIPEDFREIIELDPASAEANPAVITRLTKTGRGQFEIVVPESGYLLLPDLELFRRFHEINAITPSGTVYVAEDPFHPDPVRIDVYALETSSEGTTWYLIGNEADYQRYLAGDWRAEDTYELLPGSIESPQQ